MPPSPVPSGQSFTYFLNYSCSSTTGGATNAVITDPLPTGIEFLSVVPTVHIASFSTPAVGSSGTVTLNSISPLPSGSAGIIPIVVRYAAGTTTNGTIVTNTATVNGSNIGTASSSFATTASAAPTWTVGKTGAANATLGTTGTNYTVSLCSSGTNIGQLDLTNAVMVDTLPVGVFPSNVLNAAGATVTGTGVAGNPV